MGPHDDQAPRFPQGRVLSPVAERARRRDGLEEAKQYAVRVAQLTDIHMDVKYMEVSNMYCSKFY